MILLPHYYLFKDISFHSLINFMKFHFVYRIPPQIMKEMVPGPAFQAPLVVVSNRLPFVLARGPDGRLERKQR
jgi:hypothetical protein